MAALLKRRKVANTLVLRAKSGQRVTGGSNKFRLEADVILKGDRAELMLAPQEGGAGKPGPKLVSLINIKLGTTQLLGGTDEPGDGPSHMYFLTVQ